MPLSLQSRHQYTQPVPVTKEIPSPIASTPPSLPHHSPKVNGRKQFRKVHQRHQVMDEDGEDSDGSDSDSSPSEVEEDEVDTLQNGEQARFVEMFSITDFCYSSHQQHSTKNHSTGLFSAHLQI